MQSDSKVKFIDVDTFDAGLELLQDSTKARLGSARKMINSMITDRKGIGKRPGTLLIGTENKIPYYGKGFFNYKKSGNNINILTKAYGHRLEYLHPTSLDWTLLQNLAMNEEFVRIDTSLALGHGSVTKISQQFVPTIATMRGIIFRVAKVGTGIGSSGVVVSIQADSAGSASGTILVSKTYSQEQWNALADNFDIFAYLPIATLTPENTYHVVFDAQGYSDAANYTNLRGGTVLGITNEAKSNNGAWATYASDVAMYFKAIMAEENDSDWGFKEHLVNTDLEDYLYMGDRMHNYRRWVGAATQINGAVASGATSLVVDEVLRPQVHLSSVATSNSATTVDIGGSPWAASQWIDFYILILEGVHAGKIRKITASTANQLTFDTLGSGPGNVAFEIRQPAFPASGTLVVGDLEIAYTAIPTKDSFTVSASPAFADNTPVSLKPTEYPAAPKGNRLESHFTRMIVGNVRTAMGRDASGTLKANQSPRSYWVSKLRNASDFSYAGTRVAGEGDIVSIAYGGGAITDISNFEKQFAVFTEDYIELASYSQDSNDIIQRDQLKPGFGSVHRVIKAKDDTYFATKNNEVTSIGRVQQKDVTPQSINIGMPIKRLLDSYDMTKFAGEEFKDRLLMTMKADSQDNFNNRVLLLNRTLNSFGVTPWEGVWLLNMFGFAKQAGKLYGLESNTANVLQLFTGENDVRGETSFGFTSQWLSNWMNLTSSKFNTQGMAAVALEGYIRAGTTLKYNWYSDFSETPFLEITFTGTEEDYLSPDNLSAFLAGSPLAVEPLAAQIEDVTDSNYRHFMFQFYYPPQYGNFFSYGFENSGKDQFYEITRVGMGLMEEVDTNQLLIKT